MAPGRVVHHRGYIHPQRRLTWAAETLPPRAVEYDEKQDLVRIPMEIGQSESLVAEVPRRSEAVQCAHYITKKPGRGRNSTRNEAGTSAFDLRLWALRRHTLSATSVVPIPHRAARYCKRCGAAREVTAKA